jgi:hypothetical protein
MIDMSEFNENKKIDELLDETLNRIEKKSLKNPPDPFIVANKKKHLQEFFQTLVPEEKKQLSGVTTLEEVHKNFCKNQRLEKPKFIGFVRIAGEIPYNCFLDCKCGLCQTKEENRRVLQNSWRYGF